MRYIEMRNKFRQITLRYANAQNSQISKHKSSLNLLDISALSPTDFNI